MPRPALASSQHPSASAPIHPTLQAREAEVAAQLRAAEEEARRAAAQAAAAPPARAPLAPAAGAAGRYDDVGMAEAHDDDFEDAENLPNVGKMTVSQVQWWWGLGWMLRGRRVQQRWRISRASHPPWSFTPPCPPTLMHSR